jgi:CBS domain-containing protein
MYPVVDGKNLLGCIGIENIRKIPKSDWQNKTVGEIMDRSSATNTVSANMETEKLLATMVRPDTPSRYMVVDRDQLVGVVSLKDLLELIALKLEIEPSGQ